jgi:hypothetical protein
VFILRETDPGVGCGRFIGTERSCQAIFNIGECVNGGIERIRLGELLRNCFIPEEKKSVCLKPHDRSENSAPAILACCERF